MCGKNECIELIRNNLPYIQKEFGVSELRLFGSMARGDNRDDSDVDIFVDMPQKIYLMSGLKIFLEQLLNVSVDLVRRHSHISQKFLNQVLADGIIIL